MTRARRVVSLAVLAAFAPAGVACSSATDPTGSKVLTSREAQTVASALFTQLFGALGTSAGFARSSAAANATVFSRMPAAAGARAADATPTTNTFSAACPLGGTVAGSFTESDNVDANGTGTVAVSATYTPTACVVSTGSRNVTVSGAPSLTMTVNMSLVRYVQSGSASLEMGGGFAYEGGTCQVNYAASFNAAGHGTIRGSICGQDVSQSI